MSDEETDPKEALLKNQRKEKKDLQAKVQALKKTASKGDKKKKKEVNDEIIKLETDLNEKHKIELLEVEASTISIQESDCIKSDSINTNCDVEDDSIDDKEGRVSKAQKRRDKKAAKEKQRLLDIEKQEEENKNGIRHLEQEKIKSLLDSRNLKLKEIPSDGDCMFAGLVHQLAQLDQSSTVADLRKRTAKELLENKTDYSPFLSNPSTGEMLSDSEFETYCNKMASTPAWGGQVELQALSIVLQRPIEVVQAEGPTMVVGEQFTKQPLVLTYHRHAYGLGEHYNSATDKDLSRSQ